MRSKIDFLIDLIAKVNNFGPILKDLIAAITTGHEVLMRRKQNRLKKIGVNSPGNLRSSKGNSFRAVIF